jgi:signal transduction histidine kinase
MRHEAQARMTLSEMTAPTWLARRARYPSPRTRLTVIRLGDSVAAWQAWRGWQAWRQAWLRGWRWLQVNTFTPPWLPRRWRHPIASYVLAFLCQVVVAILTRMLIGGVPTYSFPGVVELLTVALIAVSWGAGPGIFAALVGLGLEELLVLAVLASDGGGDTTGLLIEGVVFMVVGIGISVVASRTERLRRIAVAEQAEAQANAHAMHELHNQMDQFLNTASHDVRTPVTALSGFIEVAANRFERLALAVDARSPDLSGEVAAVRDALDSAKHSAERLHQLVGLLFDTTQDRAATLVLHPAPCDLAVLVQDHLAGLRAVHPERTVHLELIPERPLPILADADRIGQVLTNYLTNALKYSTADQPVAVQVTRVGSRAWLAVRDQGPGLPAREQSRVWERFYRAEGVPVQSGSGVGLGLGLYLCKAIIEGHGGEVGIESVVGQGSTFWFTLPLAEEARGETG